MSEGEVLDDFDSRLVLGVDGPLKSFNHAGVLSASDVHVALRLARLSATGDDVVSLGAAFAARAPRLGNVCVDLATIHATADADIDTPEDIGALPWPEPATWLRQYGGQPDRRSRSAAAPGGDSAVPGPPVGGREPGGGGTAGAFRQSRTRDRYRPAAERSAGVVRRRRPGPAHGRGHRRVAETVGDRRGAGHRKDDHGGPRAGPLEAQAIAAGQRPPLVALAAPTGKAAARLEDAVRQGAADRHRHRRCATGPSAGPGGQDGAQAVGLQSGQPDPLSSQSAEPAAS